VSPKAGDSTPVDGALGIHLSSGRFKIDEPYVLATSKEIKFKTLISLL